MRVCLCVCVCVLKEAKRRGRGNKKRQNKTTGVPLRSANTSQRVWVVLLACDSCCLSRVFVSFSVR